MKKHLTKRRVVLSALVVLALAITASVAFAYFTSTGAGSSTATVGAAPNLTVTVDPISGDLLPGTSVDISGSVSNPNVTKLQLSHIVPGTPQVVIDTDHANAGCSADDFTVSSLTPSAVTLPQTLSKNGSVSFTGTLSMANTDENQDACQGATVTVNIAAS